MVVVLAIDAGTTGVRTVAVDEHGCARWRSYRELPQHYPRPGWIEHDADEIWAAVGETLAEAAAAATAAGEAVAAIGITNQRETTVVWDRATGRPRHRALVWQDRRTAARCDALRGAGHEPMVRARTGLVLDPYFSATKLEWLLTPGPDGGGVAADESLAFGTVDSWLLWNLTGGAGGGRPRDRPVERESHDALRHRRPRLVAGAAATCSGCPRRACRVCSRAAAGSA